MARIRRPPPPTLLHHYLSDLHVNWYLIRNHLNDRPEEAASRNDHGASALYKALYRRVEDYPSPVIVDLLLNAYPPAMWVHEPDHCPLRAACWRRASLPIQERLIRSRPSRPSDIHALHALWKSYDNLFGDDLLPTILHGGREGAEIWRKLYALLEYCTYHTLENYQNLHAVAAASPSCSPELICLSFSYFPHQIRQPDKSGKLPLHHFVTQRRQLPNSPNPDVSTTTQNTSSSADPTLEVLQLLLSWYPEAVNIRDTTQCQLPIHGAIAQGYPWTWIQPLVGASSDTLSQVDGVTHLYPFQLAACTDACSLTVVFELIRAAPYLLQDGISPVEGNATDIHSRSLLTIQQHSSSSVANGVVQDQQQNTYNSTERIMQQASRRDDPDMWSDVQRLLAYRSPPADQWYAVHAAASLPDCPLGLLELTVIMQSQELALRNADGDLPLHLIVRHSRSGDADDEDEDDDYYIEDVRTTRIRILLNDYPQGASLRDSKGRLPLHMAVSGGQPWSSLKALIQAYPAAVGERNESGLYPFQEAAITDIVGLTEVFELLLAAPHLLAEKWDTGEV